MDGLMYTYNAQVIKIVDGDTIDALIDIGFSVWVKKRIRLHGINTPESRTRDLIEKKAGLAAKDRLVELLESGDNKFKLVSHGVGKYGRCLGELYHPDSEAEGDSYNQTLVKEGHAKEYFGGKR